MNKIKFLVFACFLTCAISCSQQKRYVTYKIQEGETMKDVASRLDIRTKDLLKLNPDIGRKPKANTNIIIPNPKLSKANEVNSSESNETEVVSETEIDEVLDEKDVIKDDAIKLEDQVLNDSIVKVVHKYVTHTVNPKETVYAITKKYNLTKEELINLNPEFPAIKNNELSIGQVLKVEATEVKTYISLEEDLKSYVTHTVKPKETVYGLTRFYNISKEELVSLNPEYPEINDNSLSIGQVLRIRTMDKKLDTDDLLFYHDTIVPNTSIKLAVLLPFKATKYKSISAEDIFENNQLTNMVTDFYMGVEIAVDSIKQQGINVDFSVFDTGDRGSAIDSILDSKKLDSTDVVIGPFYSSKVEMVAKRVKSPVVFPHFSKNQDGFKSRNIVKSEPDIDSHTNYLTSYLRGIYSNETIFVVGDGKTISNKQVTSIVYDLKKHDSIHKVIVLKPEDGYIKKTRFTDEMKPNSHCWLIIASDDNVVVEDALNSMIVLPEDVTGQVFSIQKTKAFSNVDNNKLARVEFAYVTNNFNDEKLLETKIFNKKYNRLNEANPSDYSVKGFDVTYDVLMRLASGEKLSDTFDKGATLRLETKFNYNKKAFKATSNEGLFIVKYNKDLSLKRLK